MSTYSVIVFTILLKGVILCAVMRMTKDFILAILKNSETYISGEKISRELNISRSAVNKAVQSLRRDGYKVSSSTKKGYLLLEDADRLNMGELLASLSPSDAKRLVFLDTVDSTNSYLQRNQHTLSAGTVVIANEQTGGRGRLGRSFESPKDKGLYLSLLTRPETAPDKAANITAWTAVAVSGAIEKVTGIRPGVKWVNDLVVNGKKICGILTEMSVEGESGSMRYVITGIGVNCNQEETDFSENLRGAASSLYIESGKRISRAKLAAEIIKSLDKMREDFPSAADEYLSLYRKNCVVLGKQVRIIGKDTQLTGTAEAIDGGFGLVVRFSDGHTGTVTSGEVSVRGFLGYI